MYYVYLIKSEKLNKFYVGYTADLKKRLKEHNSGSNSFTKGGIPWDLEYYEAYKSSSAARIRESKLKHHGQGIRRLKERFRV